MKKRDQLGMFLIIILGMNGDNIPRCYLPHLLAQVLVICLYLATRAFRDGLSRAPHY